MSRQIALFWKSDDFTKCFADFRALLRGPVVKMYYIITISYQKKEYRIISKYRVDHNIFPQNFYIFHRLLCVYVCCGGGSGAI